MTAGGAALLLALAVYLGLPLLVLVEVARLTHSRHVTRDVHETAIRQEQLAGVARGVVVACKAGLVAPAEDIVDLQLDFVPLESYGQPLGRLSLGVHGHRVTPVARMKHGLAGRGLTGYRGGGRKAQDEKANPKRSSRHGTEGGHSARCAMDRDSTQISCFYGAHTTSGREAA